MRPMWALGIGPIILSMTRPTTPSRVLLLADRRSEIEPEAGVSVRRYRIARLRLENRPVGPDARYEHLKRVYD